MPDFDLSPSRPGPERRWLYHKSPDWVPDAAVYFITICTCQRGRYQLCVPDVAEELLASVRYYHESHRWWTYLWLLMPDHAHALVSCPSHESLAKVVAAWKRHTARHTGVLWQKGFFDHRLRNDENFEEKASYIRMNPVRASLVAKPSDWAFSWAPASQSQTV